MVSDIVSVDTPSAAMDSDDVISRRMLCCYAKVTVAMFVTVSIVRFARRFCVKELDNFRSCNIHASAGRLGTPRFINRNLLIVVTALCCLVLPSDTATPSPDYRGDMVIL